MVGVQLAAVPGEGGGTPHKSKQHALLIIPSFLQAELLIWLQLSDSSPHTCLLPGVPSVHPNVFAAAGTDKFLLMERPSFRHPDG